MALLCAGCAQEQTLPEPAETGLVVPVAARAQIVDLEVAWPAMAQIDRDLLAGFSEANRKAVARSRVPVLMAADPQLAENAIVMAKPAFTAISTRKDGVTISLHAHRLAHAYPHIEPTRGRQSVRGHDGWVTQNEAIWSASWVENGIAYDLDVECGTLPDARCDDASFLLELASSLRYVGGREHAAEVLR